MDSIIIGSDHAGYRLKESLLAHFRKEGRPVEDVGCYSEDSVDYPAVSARLAEALREKETATGERVWGVLCCGSGVGVAMAANRFSWVRAVKAHDIHTAVMSRRHNDANVLCLGARVIAPELALHILETWLTTPFEGSRHQNRVDMMSRMNGVESSASSVSDYTKENPTC